MEKSWHYVGEEAPLFIKISSNSDQKDFLLEMGGTQLKRLKNISDILKLEPGPNPLTCGFCLAVDDCNVSRKLHGMKNTLIFSHLIGY